MKIAVTAKGDSIESALDPRFGRAEKLLVIDSEGKLIEVVDNSENQNAAQGAGIQAAEQIAKLGVSHVVTGHCGPKALRVLSAAGITVYGGAEGTVADAIAQYKWGKLQTLNKTGSAS